MVFISIFGGIAVFTIVAYVIVGPRKS